MATIGWRLPRDERERLLARFPPVWPDIIADHVTLDADASAERALSETRAGEVVGHVNDGEGLQALVVAIDGTPRRPDGSTYHITWSLDRERGREAKDSNAVLANRDWDKLDLPFRIDLVPARLDKD
ncbi:hypothetical protein QQS45_06610 [Alteriqipengyuania flavescens]|uniref:hypothetical protein n=1 Tax=Alteriqipengyuania flavescens TaxID=3053610 RepID=UPI0025B3D846|nr:hypothetical protein [Alteriqipengyuania flavescens]WJY19880.1 hypothetical protein QQW98_06605 [Alteriqipengyuania flavescens]WJY25822.1 hypothetical protein QQS45_06610 [Alteriqipengyuania flavescens]